MPALPASPVDVVLPGDALRTAPCPTGPARRRFRRRHIPSVLPGVSGPGATTTYQVRGAPKFHCGSKIDDPDGFLAGRDFGTGVNDVRYLSLREVVSTILQVLQRTFLLHVGF